ncbi:dihydrodipicolinate synthase/N-acetylneuraminate lyase [Terriglobus roseus DSM 18391]|uniref:Dihydrodipicolinate synthase/N-acetylneuraminate lyase n=1 Tax=Terriglobus roseus (strain DSM 18391 / NRRL B-41598 / KBS 63) TaxID=926566 RepID=I3ZBW2_TERRK|nr:dihydrodipicolinate synthase family protein [Terriglobus roseus]AFL86730.1 dihydrodipicolinate synthase/N-acetylneuraminate lyase [Terriglobus roseus DSM 18391]
MIRFSGVYAALLTPRSTCGELDLTSFRAQLAAPAADKLAGYAVNGATGEFTVSRVEELAQLVKAARDTAPNAQILCGIGACDVPGAVARGHAAADAGADAVLLPMPSFFPYRQDDLRAFTIAVARELSLPVLLYNLPQFTSGLTPETVLSLLGAYSNIVGVKDSSGSLDIVRAMTDAKVDAARIIGNDSALCDAMEQGLCDGVVSGVACTLPELMTSLYATGGNGDDFSRYKDLLDDFIEHLGTLPTPWGLKVTSAVRGFARESYPFPLSTERAEEAAQLRGWFVDWMNKATEAGAA